VAGEYVPVTEFLARAEHSTAADRPGLARPACISAPFSAAGRSNGRRPRQARNTP